MVSCVPLVNTVDFTVPARAELLGEVAVLHRDQRGRVRDVRQVAEPHQVTGALAAAALAEPPEAADDEDDEDEPPEEQQGDGEGAARQDGRASHDAAH